MTRIKTDDVRVARDALIQEKVAEAAGSNRILSKAEQQKLDPFLADAAAHERADAGKGARLDVDRVAKRAAGEADVIWAKHNPPGGRGGDGKFLSRAELGAIERESPSLGQLTRLAVLRVSQGQGGASITDAVSRFFTAFDFHSDPNTGERPLANPLPGGEMIDARRLFPQNRAKLPTGARQGFDVYARLEDHDRGSGRIQRAKIDGHDVFVLFASTDGDDAYLEVYDKKGQPVVSGRLNGEELVGLDETFGRCRFTVNMVALDEPAHVEGFSEADARLAAGQTPVDWQGDVQVTQGRLEYDQWRQLGHIDAPQLEGSPRAELAHAALQYLWERSLHVRVPGGEPFLLGPQREGTLNLGTFTRPADGKEFEVARWRDIDDGSFTLYFDRTAQGRLKLAIEEFDN